MAQELSITRPHIFSGERLATFSDAVLSIVATFSVLPLKLNRETIERSGRYEDLNLETFLLGQWPRYLVYIYSFMFIADVWFTHTGVFSIVEKVDDGIIWLNLLLLFLVSFVPYATGLVSSYVTSEKSEEIAIWICAGVIFLIGVNLIIILAYAFRRQSLVHPDLVDNGNIRFIKRSAYAALSVSPVLSILAIAASFLMEKAPSFSLLVFYSVLPVSLIIRLVLYTFARCRRSMIDRLPNLIFKEVASKSRAEAFSDGVFAIVATLIVLDLTTEHIPDENGFEEKHLDVALFKQRFVFFSYTTTFIVTGLLWFVQYSMFHFIQRCTPLMVYTNNITLFLVGGIPFASEILSISSDETFATQTELTPNKILSIRVFGVLATVTGLFQFVFWCVAHHHKSYCMTEKINKKFAETLIFAKIMIIPITGMVMYWGTFNETFVQYQVYTLLALVAPLWFLILKAIISLYLKCDRARAHVKQTSSSGRIASPINSIDEPMVDSEKTVLALHEKQVV